MANRDINDLENSKFDVDGNVKVNIASGSASDGAIIDGVSSSIKATVLDKTSSNPLATAIVDANGDQITSFGGGTQYTESGTDSSITGTAIMWEDTGDTLRSVSTTKPLPVDLGTNNDVTVTGSVTANAGTNLNTSLLALEAGGNLASIKAKTDNIPALGQALAAASVPVVLTAEQITTLTPPAAITGFATETTLASIDSALINIDINAGVSASELTGFSNVLETIGTSVGLKVFLFDSADGQITDISTTAKQDTIIGHVDGIETLLGTIDADTSSIATDASTIAGDTTSIDAKTPALGQALAAASVPVVLPAAQITTLTPQTDALTNTQLRATAVPVSGTFYQATQPVSLASVPSHAVTNAGTFATQATLQTGSNAIGKLAANSGVDIGDVDVTSISAGTNLVGDVGVQPRSDSNGWSVGNFTSGDTYTALTSTAQVIKGSAGKFGGYYIYNPNSSATYVMVYDIAAASVTVGTSTAKLVFCIPATAGANIEILAGIPFTTAMSIAATTTGGGNTAPTTALEAMIWYK